MHQLVAHDPSLPSSVITNRFIDGLKREIRTVILVHRPKDLDTASSLALLQEEALMDSSSKEVKKWEYSGGFKRVRGDHYKLNDNARHQKNHHQGGEDKKGQDVNKNKTPEDKLSTLKAYRRARGLCFKCGEKWGPGHKCPLLFL